MTPLRDFEGRRIGVLHNELVSMPIVLRVPPIEGLDVAEVPMEVFDQWAETVPMELPK